MKTINEGTEKDMSSQVVRVQSFSKGSLGGIGNEVERKEKDSLESRNKDIDKNRTYLNDFYKHTEHGMYAEFKKLSKELNVSNADTLKKNATAFEGIIITSDKDFFDKLGYIPGQESPAEVKKFFDDAYEYAKQEIGFKGTDKNILCASVHYDETTPHLQLYYIPIVDSWKEKVYEKDENGKVLKNQNGSPIQARDAKGKIIYKDVVDAEEPRINRTQFWQNKGGKTSYTQMQDRFYEQISKEYGIGRGEKGSTKEHTTKAEWEQQQLDKEIVSKRKELIVHEKKIDKLKSELEYSEDGNVLVPVLATKAKVSDIQNQNTALKLELSRLQSENKDLKDDNKKIKQDLNEYSDALKDRNSIHRMAFDSLAMHRIYLAYMEKAKAKIKGLEEILKPLERIIDKAHKYGSDMLGHKKGYVECLESRNFSQIAIQDVQARKSTIEANLNEIRAIQSVLTISRNDLKSLEQEKNEISKLNPRQISLNKQIKECISKIQTNESILENTFSMTNRTDEGAINDEIRWYEKEIKLCVDEIDEKSKLVDDLTVEAQEHLKEYKHMGQAKVVLEKPIQDIIDRYDNEYEPPKEYETRLYGYDLNGLSPERIKTYTMNQWRELVDQSNFSLINNSIENVITNEHVSHHYR